MSTTFTDLRPEDRDRQIAELLARAVLKLNARPILSPPPEESAPTCLDADDDSRLSVTVG